MTGYARRGARASDTALTLSAMEDAFTRERVTLLVMAFPSGPDPRLSRRDTAHLALL